MHRCSIQYSYGDITPCQNEGLRYEFNNHMVIWLCDDHAEQCFGFTREQLLDGLPFSLANENSVSIAEDVDAG
jgi:hypothetical protein